MLLINCPHCGERAQTEFAYYGEAHIVRPEKPENLSDAEWADYVFLRTNPKGVHYERWMHAHGCRRFFNMMRDTVSGEIFATYQIGAPKPAIPPKAEGANAADVINATTTATIGKSKPADKPATAENKSADGDNKSAADNNNADNNKPATADNQSVIGDNKSTTADKSKTADNKIAGGDNKPAAENKTSAADNHNADNHKPATVKVNNKPATAEVNNKPTTAESKTSAENKSATESADKKGTSTIGGTKIRVIEKSGRGKDE